MLERTPWPETVTPVRERFGGLIDAACRWHAERSQVADPDLFALICGGSLRFDEHGPNSDIAPLLWTRIGVRALLWAGIPNWVNLNNATPWPLEVVPATWQWFDFLHHTGRFDPRSDPLWELRKPLICYGGLDFDGRWRPEDDPSPIPCECYLPYREAVGYLNRQLQASDAFYDVLRGDGADGQANAAGPAMVASPWTTERRGAASRAPARPPKRAGQRPKASRRRGSGPG
jgi:hypothetical protein